MGCRESGWIYVNVAVGTSQAVPGTPVWTFTSNNGFNFTSVCSILSTTSTTIGGPIGLVQILTALLQHGSIQMIQMLTHRFMQRQLRVLRVTINLSHCLNKNMDRSYKKGKRNEDAFCAILSSSPSCIRKYLRAAITR